jgi:hypothetical protein
MWVKPSVNSGVVSRTLLLYDVEAMRGLLAQLARALP